VKQALIIFLVFISYHCLSQDNERLWEQGKLTWDDFQAEPLFSSPNDSELSYQLSYSTTRTKSADTVILKFKTKNYINPKISWIKESQKSEKLLRYNQVIFNIIELNRRKLQYDLHRIESVYQSESVFNTHNENLNYDLRLFYEKTKSGNNLSDLDSLENKISRKLEANPLEIIPEFTEKNLGFGFNLGLGTGLFSGTINEYLSPTFNFIYGFDIAYKNAILFLNGSLSSSKVKRQFTENQLLWNEGIKTNIAILDVSLGYALVDNAKHKLTPYAGMGVFEVSVAENEGEAFNDHRITDFGLIYGLNYDFKFRKSLRFTPAPYANGYREKTENNIRARLYITHPNFENMNGTSINLAISYSFFGKIINIK